MGVGNSTHCNRAMLFFSGQLRCSVCNYFRTMSETEEKAHEDELSAWLDETPEEEWSERQQKLGRARKRQITRRRGLTQLELDVLFEESLDDLAGGDDV